MLKYKDLAIVKSLSEKLASINNVLEHVKKHGSNVHLSIGAQARADVTANEILPFLISQGDSLRRQLLALGVVFE